MITSREDAIFLDQFVNHPEMEQIIFENHLTEELQEWLKLELLEQNSTFKWNARLFLIGI